MRQMRPLLDIEQLDGGYAPDPVPPGFVDPVPVGMPTVQTLEALDGPWSQAGKYGRSVSLPYPASPDETPQVIFSNDKLGLPRPRTLHLFRSDVEIPASSANAAMRAVITYGVGGVQNQFVCDWCRGGQISLVCDSFRVEAQAYAPVGDIAYSAPSGTQILGCMISQTGSAPPRPPTFTSQRFFIDNGDTLAVLVPDFARWMYLLNSAATRNTTDEITLVSQKTTAIARYPISDDLYLTGIPLPGPVDQIEIKNNGGALAGYSVLFQLGL
jgi:hypothetical protein